MFTKILADLIFLKKTYNVSYILAILSNRGFHALSMYRLSNFLYLHRTPLIPLILTRLIQILYGIDIDYRATIDGGIIIVHGYGLVIGKGSIVHGSCIFFHGVTLGVKKLLKEEFPVVEENCVFGAGAKVLGNIVIGANSSIGPNCVILTNIPKNSIVLPCKPITILRKN